MNRRSVPLLSKSRFLAGLQCDLRLYLQCYEREHATAPDAAQQGRFDAGSRVGIIAHRLRPDGILIDEPFYRHDAAVARTKRLLKGSESSALFEAAFTEDGVRIRVDILARRPDRSWDFIEVKSTTSAKDEHIPDVAIQLHVLEQAGLSVGRAGLAHINRDYVYPGGEYDATQLFAISDITDKARAYSQRLMDELAAKRAVLELDQPPGIDIGRHCKTPYDCEFIEYCRRDEPNWSVDELPRIKADRVAALRASGVRSIADISGGTWLTEVQERVRNAVLSGEPYTSPALSSELARIVTPAHFIDFETINPALPIYPGTRPYETLPFQWSDHILHPDGRLTHHEFLAEGREDPRREFSETLIDQLAGAATIVTYSAFETTQLRLLGDALPDLRRAFDALQSIAWVDLLQIVRAHYYHPNFHGSFSIKSVLPSLVPDFGYGDLDIQEGEVASNAFLEAIDEETKPAKSQQIRRDLLAYCERDTEAMIRVVEALRATV
jgi:hypothetical protein